MKTKIVFVGVETRDNRYCSRSRKHVLEILAEHPCSDLPKERTSRYKLARIYHDVSTRTMDEEKVVDSYHTERLVWVADPDLVSCRWNLWEEFLKLFQVLLLLLMLFRDVQGGAMVIESDCMVWGGSSRQEPVSQESGRVVQWTKARNALRQQTYSLSGS